MFTLQEQREEERQAIARERRAWERRRRAFSANDMDELDAAEAEWLAATAELDRISEEIRTGKRR
jgi:hypothetical protein